MEFNGIALTNEQENVINCIKSGEDTKVQAPAGSGKTFVLEAAASVIPEKRGLYLAFNKAIADEAKRKFGGHVECKTTHALAFQHVGKNYVHRLGKITGWMVANQLGIKIANPFPTLSVKGYLILDTIKHFCYSNDPRITYRVVPKIKMNIPENQHKDLKIMIANEAQRLWEMMEDPNSDTPITHDFYLKLWALNKPQLTHDFLLLDEAQDLNPVILGAIQRQKEAQKIFVGDQFQQIYSWRGSINALQRTETTHTAYLTQSFRFGNAVADMASDILQNYMEPSEAPPRIKGFKERNSKISYTRLQNPDCVICRTNNGVISNIFECLEKGKSVYVQGGTKQTENLLKGAQDLMRGKTTWVPDLCLFKDWKEVLDYASSDSGSDLRGLVNLVNKYPIAELMEKLQATQQTNKGADITLTTGHKVKGLEFPTVSIYSDYPTLTEEKEKLTQEEINLLYVSATRALDDLDVSQCNACMPETMEKAKRFFNPEYKKYPKIKVKETNHE